MAVKRAKTIQNLFDMKYDLFDFDGVWRYVMGEPEKHGIWLVWGNEKNGKTRFAILLSDYLSRWLRVHYISGEEGTGSDFQRAAKWAKISPDNRNLHFEGYEPLPVLRARLKAKRNAPKVVVMDNITIYNDELKNGELRKLMLDFPDVLFIMLAHEDRGEPYTATAKLAKRLAKIIMYVEGLSCRVSGRCPGGNIAIDEEQAAIYHNNHLLTKGA